MHLARCGDLFLSWHGSYLRCRAQIARGEGFESGTSHRGAFHSEYCSMRRCPFHVLAIAVPCASQRLLPVHHSLALALLSVGLARRLIGVQRLDQGRTMQVAVLSG